METAKENKENIVATTCLSISIEKNDHLHSFYFPLGASYEDCHKALQEASKQIVKMAEAAVATQKAQEAQKEQGSEDGSKQD